MEKNPIAERLEALLAANHLDKAEAARRAGVVYHTVHNLWRRPQAKLSAETADKLAAVLGTTSRFILFGEAPPQADRRSMVVSMYDEFDDETRRQLEEFVLFLASKRAQKS